MSEEQIDQPAQTNGAHEPAEEAETNKVVEEPAEAAVPRKPVPNVKLVDALDVIMRASTASQAKQLRRAAPLFDWLYRVRTACGGYGLLSRWLDELASKKTRDTELLTVGLAVRFLRTSELSIEQVIAVVAHLVDRDPLYATCCTIIALIRLEYIAQLDVFLSSPAGEAYKTECASAEARGVLFAETKRPFAAAAVLVAIESGAFTCAQFLLRHQWFADRIVLSDLTPIGDALTRLVHTIMARAESQPRAVPLFVSDEQVTAAIASLTVGNNMRQLLAQLSTWQRQITRRLGAEEQERVARTTSRFQLNRLAKFAHTAAMVHINVAQDMCNEAEREEKAWAAEMREKLQERTQVCERLEQVAPSDVDPAKARERRPHVLASLEDAIYHYRVLLAVESSAHQKALAADDASRFNEQARDAEESLAAIRTHLRAVDDEPL